MLCDSGVRYLGFPLRLPVHTEDLSEDSAARIVSALPPNHLGILITYLDDAIDITRLCDKLGTHIVQLHGPIDARQLEILRSARPGLSIIKSLVIGTPGKQTVFDIIELLSDKVDAFITDTYDPATGASGATGKTHDWTVSRQVVDQAARPVILAGGLTPDNVADAIKAVQPAGVDVHTGVEDESGRKDEGLVRAFIAAASGAFADVSPSESTTP